MEPPRLLLRDLAVLGVLVHLDREFVEQGPVVVLLARELRVRFFMGKTSSCRNCSTWRLYKWFDTRTPLNPPSAPKVTTAKMRFGMMRWLEPDWMPDMVAAVSVVGCF